jgi:3-hydroxyacyl-[acyl-carrier-protein] dehydratase
VLSINEIMELLPQRYPMLMVDSVEELKPGEYAKGHKCVTYNEPYFQGHFPEKPVMPGIMIIEALTQLIHIMVVSVSEYKENSLYYAKIGKAKFYQPVIPGNVLQLETEKKGIIDNLVTCRVRAFVDETDVFTAEITVMLINK